VKPVNVAIVGATGAVGNVMRAVLEERNFPVDRLFLVASARSRGKSLQFRDQAIEVQALEEFDFSQVRIALFSAGAAPSREHAPRAVDAGCVVIDNTSCYRYDADVPLIVPACNAARIADWKQRGSSATVASTCITSMKLVVPIFNLR